MEYMLGSLDRIAKHTKAQSKRVPEHVLGTIAVSVCVFTCNVIGHLCSPSLTAQILRGLNYLHKVMRVMHRGATCSFFLPSSIIQIHTCIHHSPAQT